jgi:tRNA(His) 5'-end guanylyltransferase
MNKDSLGDRIKQYESISENYFLPKIPIIIRCDGKGFHNFVKGLERPFDQKLMDAMFISAYEVSTEIAGFKCFYTQSDEITFVLTDDADIKTQQWFGGRQNKIESITASLLTASFNNAFKHPAGKLATFDARAFQCPKEDVANVFLWRTKDWERNSLNMYCSSFFSHKQLQGKKMKDRHDMLHSIGKNWATDCTDMQKNGTWYNHNNLKLHIELNYQEINDFIFGSF